MLITNYVNSHQFSVHISHIPPVSPFSHYYLKSHTHYLFHGFFYALPDSHPPSVFLVVNYFTQYDQINFPEAHLINITTVSLFKFLLSFSSLKLPFTKGLLCTIYSWY